MRRVGEDEKPLVCALLATENNSEELKKFILQVNGLEKYNLSFWVTNLDGLAINGFCNNNQYDNY